MRSRERVERAVNLDRPDRAPIMHSLLPAALLRHGQSLVELLRKYPNDFGSSEHKVPRRDDLPPPYRAGRNVDSWGTVWRSTTDGIHGQVIDYPIRTWEEAEAYEFPPTDPDDIVEKRRREVADQKKKFYVILGFNPGNYFERLQWLLGFKTVLKSLVKRPPAFVRFADRLLSYTLDSIERTLQMQPDAIGFSDDWGAQDRLLVRPSIWRQFFKPRYRKMFNLVHDYGARVYFHTDGYIIDILEDLVEIGVDVINPQFSCHSLEDLASRVRGRICVSSDIDRQILLPRGSPREIDSYVERVVQLFGRENSGGLILRGELNMDVPLRNGTAIFDAFVTHGRYAWQQ